MRQKLTLIIGGVTLLVGLCILATENGFKNYLADNELWEEEKENEAENILDKYEQLFEQLRDPITNSVPSDRLVFADQFTKDQRARLNREGSTLRTTSLSWTERGPIYDSLGFSNGNPRAGGSYTAGMMPTFLVDTLNDASGNTVFAGSPGGGLWKCTNFLSSSEPNWLPVNDFMANLAIASICQHPTDGSIMYLATGDGNTRDIRGYGVWKSNDAGKTWNLLPSTISFRTAFKIICDANGNIYLATGGSYLQRSSDGGTTWSNVSPATPTASNPHYITDMEISTTGRLHVSIGYLGGLSGVVNHFYTDIPSTVTPSTGWTSSTGIINTPCVRMELATQGNIVYALTVNPSNNANFCYKSIDGGATFTQQNSSAYPTVLSNGQGFYNITFSINPSNSSEFITGGLDAYRSTNSGQAISLITNWVSSLPYVHADHHGMTWQNFGSESRVIIVCDGGIFLSRDGGVTWRDRNQNLAVKQFYSCAIHPASGSAYLLAGAQDNGCHQLKNAGKSYSYEVTGGDGAYVHINQQNPQIQFGTYIYNQYRRSVDGGKSWASVNITGTSGPGYFINPFDYDDGQNILYASYASRSTPNNQIVRLNNANTAAATTNTVITLPELTRFSSNTNATAFKMSPYNANRVFIGSNRGKLLRLDDAHSATTAAHTATDLTSTSFPDGYMNCVNLGTSEQYMVATFTNYGVDNIWYTSDGGLNWTAIDGNLPDIPVWWAAFEPGADNKLIIATEAGVFTTQNVSGNSTVWTANPGFPIVRTSMLKIRSSDNTIVASTYGRGLFTAQLPNSTLPQINFTTPTSTVKEDILTNSSCRGYRDYTVNVGLVNPATTGNANVTVSLQAGSTAIQGVDFDFTTNGDFGSPSNQLTFPAGMTGVMPVTVRIYDDAIVETQESFVLALSVAGSTDATVGTSNSHTFFLADNDNAPIDLATRSAQLGGYTINMNATSTPFASQRLRNRVQVIYSASELKAAGITASAAISGMSLTVVSKNSTRPFNGFTISMANTTVSQVNTGFVPNSLTQVYTGNYSTVVGENSFVFTTQFAWDGVSNLVVQFCYTNSGTADAAEDIVQGSDPTNGQYYTSIYSNSTSATTAGCSLGAASISSARVSAKFSVSFGNTIATAANAARTEFINSAGEYNFYTASGEVLNNLRDVSANLGCVSSTILEAGSTWQPFLSGQRSQKVFSVTPTQNGSTASYKISLYYSATELGTYLSNPSMLKIAKTSSVSIAGANSSNTTIASTSFTPFGSGYMFTANFTGFSNFFLVDNSVILPVKLVAFEGRLKNNQAILNWTTSTEKDAKNFEIEKSVDGTLFTNIGKVLAVGNSNQETKYQFLDDKLSQFNYYRLRMNDKNGRSTLSQVVLVRFGMTMQIVTVVNNPFKDFIDVRFAIPANLVKMQLLSSNGSVIAQKAISNAAAQVRWVLPGQLSSGSYVLRVVADDKLFTNKLIKQ